ncbi:MAG: hypothetical protein PWP31_878 [Clostridia bacterium]|nr:hypothetical protein [Clostridia bacterium]
MAGKEKFEAQVELARKNAKANLQFKDKGTFFEVASDLLDPEAVGNPNEVRNKKQQEKQ